MIIGYGQFEPALGRREETLLRLEGLLATAGDLDLLVLPELCNSGYHFSSAEMAWETSEEIGRSAFVDFLVETCRQRNMFIASGFNERDKGVLYNSAILVGPGGAIGTYRKLHLFMNEKDFFQPGNLGLPVFETDLGTIGLLVCFDWVFPEAWRVLALKGAEVICHPSNLVLVGLAQQAVPVHALTNRVFIVTCNRIGREGDLHFTGNSLIAGPDGKVIRRASTEGAEIGTATVDPELARNKLITPRNHIFRDRRPEAYDELAGRPAVATKA
jgi:predicted amidohydrolase